MAYYGFQWRPYVPVWKRRQAALKKVKELSRKGRVPQPVQIEGRKIAHTFWGTAWCDNLESYSDFSNRLPRGRTYVRNGSVIDLQISEGKVNALVSGSEIYKVEVSMKRARKELWESLKAACLGKIDSVVELLQGRFSDGVMELLTSRSSGLFPSPGEIEMKCSCPDWATMCKHVAAVLYGVGARLDSKPDLLVVLRSVDAAELISRAAEGALGGAPEPSSALADDQISEVFGIELDDRPAPAASKATHAAVPSGNGQRKLKPPEITLIARRARRLRKHFLQHDALSTSEYRILFGLTPNAARSELTLLKEAWYLIQETPRRYVAGVELH